jgi:cellulose synthase (UDP-forming)
MPSQGNQFLPILETSEKYLYTKHVSGIYKILSVLSILAWSSVLFGFYITYQHHSLVLLFFGSIFAFIATYLSLSSIINTFYKNFDVAAHVQFINNFWKGKTTMPSVDILLPICGEKIEVLQSTWEGVKTLQEKHGKNVRVFVLDDKDAAASRNLAAQFGFNYLVRPNRGEMKKAGNLKYGLSQSEGEFVIIFDADFRPHPDFIEELLPYMADTASGIVQSPQYFDTSKEMHKHNPLQYGAGNIQHYFYKIIQCSRGGLGGSICVGSNAIYRRAALNTIGGTAQKEHSEDVWTGFKLLSKGWKVKYVPVILAKGICPDNQYSFFYQQIRWCSGSMSLMTSREFWTSPIKLQNKLTFISGFMYYIASPLTLFLPFLNIILLTGIVSSPDVRVGVYYLPSLILSLITLHFYAYPRARLGTLLAHVSTTWAYSYILVSLLLGIKAEWKPSGSTGKISNSYYILTTFSTLYLITYVSLMYFCAYIGKIHFTFEFSLILFWIAVTIFAQVTYVVNQWAFIFEQKKAQENIGFQFGLAGSAIKTNV